MAFAQFPAPAAGGASVAAFAASIAAKNVTNIHTQAFEAGVYTITCVPTSTNVTVGFLDSTSLITTQVTTAGIVGFTLASPATQVSITAKNDATIFPTIITIEKTANPLTSVDVGSGTLDTINTTGTYNETGLLAVLAISGGAHGVMGNVGATTNGGAGGAAGNIAFGTVVANTATTVTVGAKGVARDTIGGTDTAATNSSFGNLVVAGNTTSAFISKGNGASGGSDNFSGAAATANQTFPSWNTTGTSGGGGGGGGGSSNSGGNGPAPAGSGIGTGGAGGTVSAAGNDNRAPLVQAVDATGKGAGGGGGSNVGNNSANNTLRLPADGSDGVVFILRGF